MDNATLIERAASGKIKNDLDYCGHKQTYIQSAMCYCGLLALSRLQYYEQLLIFHQTSAGHVDEFDSPPPRKNWSKNSPGCDQMICNTKQEEESGQQTNNEIDLLSSPNSQKTDAAAKQYPY